MKKIIIILILSVFLMSACNKTTENIKCTQDSDCILSINKEECCNCPKVVSKQEMQSNSNLIVFDLTEDYSTILTKDCSRIECQACEYPKDYILKCIANKCEITQK
ncbi:MAG: hypothetical protein PHD81_02810 [Candidatus Nanoarchaeia archaeon]|nr:hypothetical protein [Candidatus Nanoarchaeia archaeon]MDD5588015.1 hypothetical protein [Candidatus Nanoarchaeia archaeon]